MVIKMSMNIKEIPKPTQAEIDKYLKQLKAKQRAANDHAWGIKPSVKLKNIKKK